MCGGDLDTRGLRRIKKPGGVLSRTTLHLELGLVYGECARIVQGEDLLGKLNANSIQAKQLFRQDRG